MTQTTKGYTETWFELCNADGHPLMLATENRFQTEVLAAAAASTTCVDYRDTVTVKQHTITILRVFNAQISAVEMP